MGRMSELNCGATCAKYILFAFNILFFLCGGAVLGVGIWVVVDSGSFASIIQKIDPDAVAALSNNIFSDSIQTIKTVGYIFIGVGSFVFLVAFLGCCGACKEWRPFLVTYAILLLLIVGVEVGVGIWVGVNKDTVVGKVKTELTNTAKYYDYMRVELENGRVKVLPTPLDDRTRLNTTVWNALMTYIGCCGASNYLDFQKENSPYWSKSQVAPVFCCKFSDPGTLVLQDTACFNDRAIQSNRMTGCVDKVENFVKDNAPIIIGVAVGIGLIELVGIFFAFCLCCAIGDKEKY